MFHRLGSVMLHKYSVADVVVLDSDSQNDPWTFTFHSCMQSANSTCQ